MLSSAQGKTKVKTLGQVENREEQESRDLDSKHYGLEADPIMYFPINSLDKTKALI